MDNKEILSQLTPIFQKVFGVSDIKISESTSAMDVEEWDSITHVQLIVAVEKHFKIKFSSGEIRNFKNVGELVEAIKAKMPV